MVLNFYGYLGATGLTATLDLWRSEVANAGAVSVVGAALACVEVGGGLYVYSLGTFDLDTYDYFGVMQSGSTKVPVLWTRFSVAEATRLATLQNTLEDVLEDTGSLVGGVQVVVVSAVTTDGDMVLYRGNDYKNANGTALDFSLTNAADLTGATVIYYWNKGTAYIQKEAVLGSTGGATQTLYVELTSAESLAFTRGDWAGELRAILADGSEQTLSTGTAHVYNTIRPPQ